MSKSVKRQGKAEQSVQADGGSERESDVQLVFDGERFVPGGIEGEVELEHYHRYLASAELVKDLVVGDVACGAGYGTAILGKFAKEVTGIDISELAVASARNNFASSTVRFKVGDCTSLPFEDASLDALISFETIEHITAHDRFLDECRRVLRPEGLLIISTPDRERYNAQLAEPNPHHLKELSEREFTSALRRRFKNVTLAGQRVAFGSIILPQTGVSRFDSLKRTGENAIVRERGYDRSIYLIAVCTDGAAQRFPAGSFEGGFPPNALSSMIGGIKERDQIAADLRLERARIAESRDTFAKELDYQTIETRSVRTRLEGALALAAEKQAQIAELETALGDSLRRNVDLDDQLGAMSRELEARAVALDDAANDLIAARVRVDDAEQQKDELARYHAKVIQDFQRAATVELEQLRASLAEERAANSSLRTARGEIEGRYVALCEAHARQADQLLAVKDEIRLHVEQTKAGEVARREIEAAQLRASAEIDRLHQELQTAADLIDEREGDLSSTARERLLAEVQLRRARFIGVRAVSAIWRRIRQSPTLAAPFDLLALWARMPFSPIGAAKRARQVHAIRRSKIFDEQFYASAYFDVRITQQDPVRHYFLFGAGEGRDPAAGFSTRAYLSANPDVEENGLNPLYHYLKFGRNENRRMGDERRRADPPRKPLRLPVQAGKRSGGAAGADAARLTPEAPVGPGDLYSIRPDEVVKVEALRGEDFIDRHQLIDGRSDFASAAAVISAKQVSSSIITRADPRIPDVSVVVPVHGQLAYTLNCLDSLLHHQSTRTFEIIVMDDRSPDETRQWLHNVPSIRFVHQEENQGFLKTCNNASEIARGEHLVLLNNDTRVVEGWLDELINTFKHFPKAGLVGSKLFYPDGTLQEAGGIIWRDGSAWNYGRDDDPNRPEYCYARRVDYVSGASICVPLPLWRKLGGFDEAYRPAYCEDSDLAFRIREAGHDVIMQPLSRVIHYEGKSSGTDTSKGVKAYQVVNSKRLFEKWRGVLQDHRPNGEEPFKEKDRQTARRVLVIDASTPTPDQDAGSVTTWMNCLIYRDLGYQPHFVPEDNMLFQKPYSVNLQRLGIECHYAPFDWNLEDHLKHYGSQYDFVQVFRSQVARKTLPLLRKYAPQAPIAFNNMDLQYLRIERQARISGDAKLMADSQRHKLEEFEVIRSVDCTVVPSYEEASILERELPGAPVVVLPYMTDLVGSSVPFEARRDLVFVGGYRHTPNVDAVIYFVKEVWPHIRPYLPGAKFYAVGANPTPEVYALAADDVIVTGRVDDLAPYLDRARVCVCPIRYGAGVKGKVTTSMAHALPVVATPIAAEGMGVTHESDILIAESPEDFAAATVRLYNDAALWRRLSAASLVFADEHNSTRMGMRVIRQVIDVATSVHAKRRIRPSPG